MPEELGSVSRIAKDNGYFSADNVEKLVQQDIEPYIVRYRPCHNSSLEERLAEPPKAPEKETNVEAMQHRMRTPEGQKFYALRKSTVEPVFGIIKEIMGAQNFMLRGFEAVKGSFPLVCIAYNLKLKSKLNV